VRNADVTYAYRPLATQKNTPKPITEKDLTPVYSHGLRAATVQALEDRGIVKLSPVDQDHGNVVALIASKDTPEEPKEPGHVTVSDVKLYPHYYIAGDGYAAANASNCSHNYRITDSCPLCP
jgi:hypothetical protein